MLVNPEMCNGCGLCGRDCPLGSITIKEKLAVIDETCVECRTCFRVCPRGAVSEVIQAPEGSIICDHCPVGCHIPAKLGGACGRYENIGAEIVRIKPLIGYETVAPDLAKLPEEIVQKPLITAINAGGTYPDYVPAPYIVADKRDGVDVVTVVTEAPLSYSGVKLKIDTDLEIGAEGSEVKFEGRTVGMVETEEYGSKILAVGGVNRLTGQAGFAAARAVAAIANREALKLKVKGGAKLEVKVGREPVINGEKVAKMRVGCGSATAGLFAPFLKKAADEAVVLDHHITSLFTHHAAGRCLGLEPSGLDLIFRKSTPGRFFGEHGHGWGGTPIENPLDVVKSVDTSITKPGTRLLITETTGQNAAMFVLNEDGAFEPMALTPEAKEAVAAIAETCQESRVSAVYVAGVGGSARAGVARYPLRLTKAVHAGQANLTCGGGPVFLYPGGGITFMVDVEQVRAGAFTWVPTPATVAPIEYTMRLDDYLAMGGHQEAIRPFKAVEPELWTPDR